MEEASDIFLITATMEAQLLNLTCGLTAQMSMNMLNATNSRSCTCVNVPGIITISGIINYTLPFPITLILHECIVIVVMNCYWNYIKSQIFPFSE